ncbi:acyl-CoA dehydrogenase family protein [Halorarius halobius]|uniref:acyl-CoA dehydrogenase family protein n=1 Tax=Halorarius halobius TaxID=2962671 RepID=UPI0020CB9DD8|nr:acyl-CoA dehydrogenase family protein [Halorarius halobius]
MLSLTDEQEMVLASLEDIATREFADRAFEWGGEPPLANVELLANEGFLGLNIDEAYGGGGMSELTAMLAVEAVGRVCPDTAEYLYNQQLVGPRAIEMFGSEAAKQRYLPPVTSGEGFVAVAISEPEAGSDIKSMRTTVEDLVLNGEKIWVSNVPHATALVVWVRFDDGFGSVVVDLDWDGVSVQQHYTNMHGGTQSQLRFEDVEIPEANVLTRGDDAFLDQLKALNWERLGSATLANALAGNALDKALAYAQQREQFDQPIADFQGIEWKLADMVTRLEAARTLTYRAALDADDRDGVPDRLHTSLAKLYASESAERVVSEALQIHGANGYQQGHPLEYLHRMVRGRRLAAGTDEIQKNQIAAELKKRGLPELV